MITSFKDVLSDVCVIVIWLVTFPVVLLLWHWCRFEEEVLEDHI